MARYLDFGFTFVAAPGEPPLTADEIDAASAQYAAMKRRWAEESRRGAPIPVHAKSPPDGPFYDFLETAPGQFVVLRHPGPDAAKKTGP